MKRQPHRPVRFNFIKYPNPKYTRAIKPVNDWTKIELDIQNSLSGTLKKGDSITLYQSGEGMEYNMISNQILQTTVDGLKEISRVDLCVIDAEALPVLIYSLVFALICVPALSIIF